MTVDLSIPSSFEGMLLAGEGILIYPIYLQNAVLYVFESESNQDASVAIKDPASGVELRFNLPAQRAALAIVDESTKQVVAKFGF